MWVEDTSLIHKPIVMWNAYCCEPFVLDLQIDEVTLLIDRIQFLNQQLIAKQPPIFTLRRDSAVFDVSEWLSAVCSLQHSSSNNVVKYVCGKYIVNTLADVYREYIAQQTVTRVFV